MKGLLTILFFSISFLSIAQKNSVDQVEIDKRLFDVYEKEYLINLQTKNPNLLLRWAFYLDNAYYITDFPKDKGNPNFDEVIIADLENLNILLLEKEQRLTREFKKRVKYKIKGSDKVLVYYSGEEFNQKLNEHLGRK